MRIKKLLAACTFALALTAAGAVLDGAAMAADYTPQFTADGKLIRPDDQIWRTWIFVGAIATPNALNGGEAPFPEFHSVYIEPEAFAHYSKTGEFMDGTVIAKELGLIRAPDGANEDGSTDEVSGTGYFMGEFSGFEITIKSKARYPDEPGNWAFFTFGHHGPPYQETAAKLPAEACNACHEASAEQDFVFTQFYPVLRAARP